MADDWSVCFVLKQKTKKSKEKETYLNCVELSAGHCGHFQRGAKVTVVDSRGFHADIMRAVSLLVGRGGAHEH